MKRQALSLVEVIVVMAISSVALAICILALSRVQEVDSRARAANDLHRTLARLAVQLRDDCQRAETVRVITDRGRSGVGFTFDGEPVDYERQEDRLLRRERLAGKTRFNSFTLPRDVQLNWAILRRGERQVLELRLSPGSAVNSSVVSFQKHRIVGVIAGGRKISGLQVSELR